MAQPIDETPDLPVSLDGDVPDGRSLGPGIDAAPDPEEEPLRGSLEDVESGALVGWSD